MKLLAFTFFTTKSQECSVLRGIAFTENKAQSDAMLCLATLQKLQLTVYDRQSRSKIYYGL